VLATWDICSEKSETCVKKLEKGKPLLNAHASGYLDNQAARRHLLSLSMGGKQGKEDTNKQYP
jgi:hypothetical protein